ncbi:hypothetical protein HUG17_4401 [Dermatophagoides farinae]|uniref:Carbonic anhydrase n=1 Tax=Dermatophagoides farinae TaxID=6954 RepID=A0A9D4NZX2_DERFA|nr:hypothetical protein HUG17_4401 [Dermatophagoides farinae]
MSINNSMNKFSLFTFILILHHYYEIEVDAFQKWTYNDQKSWSDVSKECDDINQSPINIRYTDLIFNESLKIEFRNYNQPSANFRATNHGRSVQFDYIGNSILVPTITGSALNDEEFALKQFHFHWGIDPKIGSEHRINGHIYPIEMHLIHYNNKKYRSYNQALDARVSTSNGIGPVVSGHRNTWHQAARPPKQILKTTETFVFGQVSEGDLVVNAIRDSTGLWAVINQPTHSIFNLWHNRLGHPGKVIMDRVHKINPDVNNKHDNCDHCCSNKSVASSHKLPMPKSDAAEAIIDFITRRQARYKCQVRQIRTDCGQGIREQFKKIQQLQTTHTNHSIDLQDQLILQLLLPNNTASFYRYHGSVTTPPCTSNVTWLIMDDPNEIEFNQYEKFLNVIDHKSGKKIGNNFRRLQEPNGRRIECSFLNNNAGGGSGDNHPHHKNSVNITMVIIFTLIIVDIVAFLTISKIYMFK